MAKNNTISLNVLSNILYGNEELTPVFKKTLDHIHPGRYCPNQKDRFMRFIPAQALYDTWIYQRVQDTRAPSLFAGNDSNSVVRELNIANFNYKEAIIQYIKWFRESDYDREKLILRLSELLKTWIVNTEEEARERTLQRSIAKNLDMKSDESCATALLLFALYGLCQKKFFNLQNISSYISECTHQLVSTLPSTIGSDFVGRQQQFKDIQQMLEQYTQPIFLWGVGGIGKTELAIEFARRYYPQNSHFVVFTESIRKTILSMGFQNVFSYQWENDDINGTMQYKDKLNWLGQYNFNELLIIDNFDSLGDALSLLRESEYNDLVSVRMRIIFTTRDFHESGQIEVKPMADSDLITLFRKYYFREILDDVIKQFIKFTDGNTLVIELIARTLQENRELSPQELLNAFQERKVDEMNSAPVHTQKDRKYKQAKIYEHLQVLFDVSRLDDDMKNILTHAIAIPITGVDYSFFLDLTGNEYKPAIDQLINCGWLRLNSEQDIITVHPVITTVLTGELHAYTKSCINFTNKLKKIYTVKAPRPENILLQTADMLENITLYFDIQPREKAACLYEMGRILGYLGHYPRMVVCEKAAIKILESEAPKSLELAQAYNNHAISYDKLGEPQKAVHYLKLSKEIREKYFPKEKELIYSSYNTLAWAYGKCGEYEKHYYYAKKAMNWRKQHMPKTREYARSLDNYGLACCYLHKFEEGFKYLKQAYALYVGYFNSDHLVTVTLAYHIAELYFNNYDSVDKELVHAIRWSTKAEKGVNSENFPENHPITAKIYFLVGSIYELKKQFSDALNYYEKALYIQEMRLSEKHPDRVKTETKIRELGSRYLI